MADLKCVDNHRKILLVWSVIETLLFTSIVYGWAALVIVFKQEHYFQDLCEAGDADRNSTQSNTDGDCVAQEERLNLVFLAGAMSFSASGFLSGPFLDRFGPRKTRLLASFLFGLSFLCLVLADKDRPYLIFPGIVILSAAGLSLLMTIFQIANMFEKWKSSIVSLFNGAVDSSAIVLLFFKLAYDGGIPLRSIIIFYFLFALIAVLVFTFVLPPYTITSERIHAIRRANDPGSSHESINKHVDEPLVVVEGGTQLNGTVNGSKERRNGRAKTPEKNGRSPKDDADLQLSPLCEPEASQEIDEVGDAENVGTESREDSDPRLMSLVLTAEYILLVLFLSVCNLRLWFYVGSLNSYLEFMSDHDIDTVSHYTNWFGIIQFAGFIFAPFVGFAMDWKPKKKRNQKTDIGFVVGFLLTSFVALLLNILVLVPILSVQYASFVIQVVLRAFVYAVYTAFILHKFPLLHFGKLFGTGHLISSALGSIQYGLFSVAEETLEKDPFWVNVGLLVVCLFLNVLPAVLWFKERRQETPLAVNR